MWFVVVVAFFVNLIEKVKADLRGLLFLDFMAGLRCRVTRTFPIIHGEKLFAPFVSLSASDGIDKRRFR